MADTHKKILVVDDDSFLLDMYSMKFSQSGFEVTTAPEAALVLEKLRGGGVYDAMVIDLMMPGMDGFQLIEEMRTEHLAESAVKIVLSNLGSETDIKRCLELGVNGYIVKANATPDEVVERINASLLAKQGTH